MMKVHGQIKLTTPEPADRFYHHWKLDNQVLCASPNAMQRKIQSLTYQAEKKKRKMRIKEEEKQESDANHISRSDWPVTEIRGKKIT